MAKRRMSEKKRRMYRRRRIAAALLAVLFLLVCAGLVWGVGAGIRALRGGNGAQGTSTSVQQSSKTKSKDKDKQKKDSGKKRSSGAPDCGKEDLALELAAPDPSTGVGGSIDFTATIRHKGTGSCLVDGSDGGRVLIITSGEETIWRSDACPVGARTLLMATGDKDVQTITWNADSSQDSCLSDDQLPRVNAGSYQAKLVLKANPRVVSQPVPVMVQ
ncbi:hypothetical protein J3T92_08790 [Bifidobacterium sp. B4081]|uniref:hypothetical protein n=1 Tax=unclassified Bifidobacterium TaxID=2608897 RepID=UPI00226AAF05|nr:MULTISPECIES: hypothetical protein [unclassified Bifidobacterium]MCX8644883.1 hypothetical protein [Bifidobacterium sp. B4077]MCX8646697.1 hypothetical protein [Bifidobacterium sp. B4081]MCX8668482.1 hypothetical protein [Bifidobacterium sp. B3998]